MNFRKEKFLYRLLMMIITIGAFAGASYAQSVTIGGATPSGTPIPNPTATPAPSGSFDVVATPAGGTFTSVVFYRNDIPIATVTSGPFKINQNLLGQDTYTYHARATFSGGAVAESNDFKISVTTPRIVTMGVNGFGLPTTTGPDFDHDHTTEVQDAVDYLSGQGGGTLFFPCLLPEGADQAKYNISATIDVPANVTLQGESSERWGKCRIYWLDVNAYYGDDPDYCNEGDDDPAPPENQRGRPMFRVNGDNSRVRFRDLAIFSRASGPDCYPRQDPANIEDEETTGIELNTGDPYCGGKCSEDPGGDITDVIFENVGIYDFTYGIKAVSDGGSAHEISGVKIRGYSATTNFRQLYIDSPNAYNWDVQNLNISAMFADQGGVEIVNAGGGGDGLKFLQLNCNGLEDRSPAFCVDVQKHGGLYFRQLHHEGVHQAIIVEDISGRTNPDPIVMESGIATGIFQDASMTLYLIGNAIFSAPETNPNPTQDDGRLRFSGDGLDSTVYDCGDFHNDITDFDPTVDYAPEMVFTYSERNRTSFFAEEAGSIYPMVHTVCPTGIDAVGGEYFDSGVLPNEPGLYSNILSTATCGLGCNVNTKLNHFFLAGGSIYINGSFSVNSTVTIPKGTQIIGAPNSEITLAVSGQPLFRIEIPTGATDDFGASGIVIRNLKLKTTQTGTTIGLQMLGEDDADRGVSRDLHFGGLTIEGFSTGIEARSYGSGKGDPMIDGISLKDISFVNNGKAVDTTSQNASNWNVMNLNIASNTASAEGWYQTYGGHQGMQDVRCAGTTYDMEDCIRLQMSAGFFLNALKKTQNVVNDLTVALGAVPPWDFPNDNPQLTIMTLRNNDFTSASANEGRVKLDGKAVITSMNNAYQYFSVSSSNQANISRLTHCGDTYPGTPYTTSLLDDFLNHWVGHNTPTRMTCGSRPVPWDDAVRWTYDYEEDENVGTPLVGNIFDNTKEDFVVYVPDSTSRFLAQQPDGPGRWDIPWGSSTHNDKPLIGKFFPASSRAQIVVYRPKTATSSEWKVLDPSTCNFGTTPPSSCTTYLWYWGSDTHSDIPFIGNFFDESGGAITGNMDEIGIYRPGTNDYWILNPRSGAYIVLTPANSSGSTIRVGDFLGKGYDQIAQYNTSNGNWYITDPRTPFGEYTSNVTGVTETSADIPVAGKYLSTLSGKDPCIQVGVWRPSNQTFYIAEVNPTPYGGAAARNCGTRDNNMVWGSNDDFGSQTAVPDIPLTIRGNSGLRRPTTYRPTKGAFDKSIADGQWWVHDLF